MRQDASPGASRPFRQLGDPVQRPTQEQIRLRLEQIESDHRHERQVMWRAVGLLLLWPLLALLLMGWGMHTRDPQLGVALFQCGVYLGNTGIAGTLLWAWWRAHR